LAEGAAVTTGSKPKAKLGHEPLLEGDSPRGMKILIAEDNGTSRRLLSGFLAGRGYSVIEATDGNEALGILLEEDPPSLAVVDWLMPGLSGSEICRRIRDLQERRPYQYLILLTVRREREWLLEGLRSGADDYIVKPFDPEELELRIAAGRRVLSTQEALMHAARHDALTGILNRGALIEREEAELARFRREGNPLSVLMIDLDHFKEVNDVHGHLVGDEVLREAVRRILGVLREYDFLGRYGGEEFLAVLPGLRNGDARAVAERIRMTLSASPVSVLDKEISVTLSIGVATYEGDGSVDDLNRAADEALYRAKEAGRNQVAL
jgi:diguanylate cyclase (GGDEF)-like protein